MICRRCGASANDCGPRRSSSPKTHRCRAGWSARAACARARPGTSITSRRTGRCAGSSPPAISRGSTPRTRAPAVAAAGCLLQYVKDTQRSAVPHLRGLVRERRDEAIVMDAETPAESGDRDRRRRRRRVHAGRSHGPLHNADGQPAAQTLAEPAHPRPTGPAAPPAGRRNARPAARCRALRSTLREIGDIERILSRVALGSARPRDLAQLRDALERLPGLTAAIAELDSPLLAELAAGGDSHGAECAYLQAAIVAQPPVLLKDGGVVAPGFDAELDALRVIGADAGRYLDELEQRERERTGLGNLKVGYNRVHGYYIEISKSQADARARRLHSPPDPEGRGAVHHPAAQDLRGQGARRAGARAQPRAGALRTSARAAERGFGGPAAHRGADRRNRRPRQPGPAGAGDESRQTGAER